VATSTGLLFSILTFGYSCQTFMHRILNSRIHLSRHVCMSKNDEGTEIRSESTKHNPFSIKGEICSGYIKKNAFMHRILNSRIHLSRHVCIVLFDVATAYLAFYREWIDVYDYSKCDA
jgi:hypothetical protein